MNFLKFDRIFMVPEFLGFTFDKGLVEPMGTEISMTRMMQMMSFRLRDKINLHKFTQVSTLTPLISSSGCLVNLLILGFLRLVTVSF